MGGLSPHEQAMYRAAYPMLGDYVRNGSDRIGFTNPDIQATTTPERYVLEGSRFLGSGIVPEAGLARRGAWLARGGMRMGSNLLDRIAIDAWRNPVSHATAQVAGAGASVAGGDLAEKAGVPRQVGELGGGLFGGGVAGVPIEGRLAPRSIEPVVADPIETSLRGLRDRPPPFVGTQTKLINGEGDMPAEISRNSFKKMLSSSATNKSTSPSDHATAIANADQLFANSRRYLDNFDRVLDPNIGLIHRFRVPMSINGRTVWTKLTVKETRNPASRALYTVETLPQDPDSVPSGLFSVAPVAAPSVAEGNAAVKKKPRH
jgi:hypothetical protein